MTPTARIQTTIEILEELGRTSQSADRFIRDWFRTRRYAGSKDRAAVAELVFDVFRHRASYAWRMQSEAPRALVIASVLAEKGDVEAQFNGVAYGPASLSDAERAAIHTPPENDPPLHVRHEFPEFLEKELTRSLGASLPAEMEALQARAPVDLRVNNLKATREDVLAQLREDGIDASATLYSPFGIRVPSQMGLALLRRHDAFENGLFEFQDEAAQIAALLAHVKPGERVLDFAAGAGGKALALGAEMSNDGEIVACDVAMARLLQIRERAERSGITIIKVHEGAAPHEEFDLVFVDAPCSGSGTWRRQPDQKWRLTQERLAELTVLQDKLLAEGAARVRPGGRLVYATCSILKYENEDRIEAFLNGPLSPIGGAAATGSSAGRGEGEFTLHSAKDIWVDATNSPPPPGMNEFFRATPRTTGTDGFFTAILVRKGSV